MRREDCEQLIALAHQHLNPLLSATMFYDSVADPGCYIRVCTTQKNLHEITAFAFWRIIVDELELDHMLCHPTWQRQGHARALLQDGEDFARRRGIRKLLLEVSGENHAAVRLYRDFGFCEVGSRKGYYQPRGQEALLMSKGL